MNDAVLYRKIGLTTAFGLKALEEPEEDARLSRIKLLEDVEEELKGATSARQALAYVVVHCPKDGQEQFILAFEELLRYVKEVHAANLQDDDAMQNAKSLGKQIIMELHARSA